METLKQNFFDNLNKNINDSTLRLKSLPVPQYMPEWEFYKNASDDIEKKMLAKYLNAKERLNSMTIDDMIIVLDELYDDLLYPNRKSLFFQCIREKAGQFGVDVSLPNKDYLIEVSSSDFLQLIPDRPRRHLVFK